MTEQTKQAMSSFFDEERISDQNLESILKDQSLKASWARYQIIGDVIRDELPNSFSKDFADEIARAIADEPTVLAPMKRKAWLSSPVIKQFSGMAVAASVTAIAIVGFQWTNSANQSSGNSVASVTSVPNVVVPTTPLAAQVVSQTNNNVATYPYFASEQQGEESREKRLRVYLIDHYDQSVRQDNPQGHMAQPASYQLVPKVIEK